MIFHSALVRELRATAWIAFSALLTIVVSTTLIRILNHVANGRSDPSLVVPLLALSSANSLNVVVGLTAFLSVLLVLGRWWRESEMAVWLASGLSPWRFVGPVLSFATPLVLISAFCSLVLSPWARGQMDEVRESFQERADVDQISTGQFRESASGQWVFFVEMLTESSEKFGKVFAVARGENSQLTVINGQAGEVIQDAQGVSWFRILDGTRTDFSTLPDSFHQELQTMRFGSHEVRSDVKNSIRVRQAGGLTTISTAGLIATPTPYHLGELAFRIGSPLLSLTLVLLAIPLAYVGQREGRWYPLLFALLVVILSNNLLSVTKAWVSTEQIPFALGWWLLPSLVGLLFLALMWWRSHVRRAPLSLAHHFSPAPFGGNGKKSAQSRTTK